VRAWRCDHDRQIAIAPDGQPLTEIIDATAESKSNLDGDEGPQRGLDLRLPPRRPGQPGVSVLILARDFDPSVDAMIPALTARDAHVYRVNTGWFPTQMELMAQLNGRWHGQLITPRGPVELEEVTAVWYRSPEAYAMPHQLSPGEAQHARVEAKYGLGGSGKSTEPPTRSSSITPQPRNGATPRTGRHRRTACHKGTVEQTTFCYVAIGVAARLREQRRRVSDLHVPDLRAHRSKSESPATISLEATRQGG
jgi:hypothetical protein